MLAEISFNVHTTEGYGLQRGPKKSVEFRSMFTEMQESNCGTMSTIFSEIGLDKNITETKPIYRLVDL